MSSTDILQKQIQNLLMLKSVQKSSRMISELNTLQNRISDKTFRIAVVGEFSSGKSTFINAMIGKNILKHASAETTAAITYIYNVRQGDAREGTCEILFHNGTVKILSDLQQLKNYTTVNEICNVAETIRSVTVYVHFLNCTYPLLITDTPGLNGIADKHRDITLDEIRKAHMCIYLLSNNGVKLSDGEFIKILLRYQNRFIFVQNFVDMLRTSEGETCESKLDKDRENLKICFQDHCTAVQYQLFGISAVKALAAKDRSIEKVFESDPEPISNRAALLEESNFASFENGLTDIINSGEYLHYITASAAQTLLFLIEQLENGLESESKISEEMRKHDRRNLRIESSRTMIRQLQDQIPEKERSLENFMMAQDADNRSTLKKAARTQSEELNSDIVKEMDDRIRKYEDLDALEIQSGKTVPKYFSDRITQILNVDIIPSIDKNITENLDHLFDQALLKVTNFASSAQKTADRIHIHLQEKAASFDPDSVSGLEQIERDKIKVSTKQRKLQNAENKKNNAQREHDLVKEKLRDAERERNQAEKTNHLESERLGSMPVAGQIRVEQTREVERTGLFHKTRDCLFGKKTETYYVYQADYTKQNEWKQKKAEAERCARARLERCEQNIQEIMEKRDQIEAELLHSQTEQKKLEADIRDLNARIKREEDIYEKVLQANKQEFCDNEKKRMKEDIKNTLFALRNGESVLEHMEHHIDNMSESNLPAIRESVMTYFKQSVSERIQSLQEVIDAGSEELQQIYDLCKNDLKELDKITKTIKKGVMNYE